MNIFEKNIGTAVSRADRVGQAEGRWKLSAVCNIVEHPGNEISVGAVRYLTFSGDGYESMILPNDASLLEQIASLFTKAAEFVASQDG